MTNLGKEEILLRCRRKHGCEWVACLGQTHKNDNTVQMKQEVDKEIGARRGRRERDKKETTWEVVIVCLG